MVHSCYLSYTHLNIASFGVHDSVMCLQMIVANSRYGDARTVTMSFVQQPFARGFGLAMAAELNRRQQSSEDAV